MCVCVCVCVCVSDRLNTGLEPNSLVVVEMPTRISGTQKALKLIKLTSPTLVTALQIVVPDVANEVSVCFVGALVATIVVYPPDFADTVFHGYDCEHEIVDFASINRIIIHKIFINNALTWF